MRWRTTSPTQGNYRPLPMLHQRLLHRRQLRFAANVPESSVLTCRSLSLSSLCVSVGVLKAYFVHSLEALGMTTAHRAMLFGFRSCGRGSFVLVVWTVLGVCSGSSCCLHLDPCTLQPSRKRASAWSIGPREPVPFLAKPERSKMKGLSEAPSSSLDTGIPYWYTDVHAGALHSSADISIYTSRMASHSASRGLPPSRTMPRHEKRRKQELWPSPWRSSIFDSGR